MTLPVLSFFTGGGLFDLGFKQAGFSICWTNENCPAFISGYEHGMSSWLSSLGARSKAAKITNTNSICDLTERQVLREAFHRERPSAYGVIGGPPCPDFSNGGTHAGGKGSNGKLTSVFVNLICSLRPSFFVIENVAGLYRFHKHRAFLEGRIRLLQACDYCVDWQILNALELGVPQNRERLFVVGVSRSLAQRAAGRRIAITEKGWFPWPINHEYTGAQLLPWPKVNPFGKKPVRPARIPSQLTVYPALLGNGDPESLANGTDYFNPRSARFTEVQEGDVSHKSFKRLHRYRFSPTVWYGNQEVHLHPWKARRLSVREALRIQTVPDEYVLPADISLSAKFKMICNGVPCVMAKALAESVHAFLMKCELGRPRDSRMRSKRLLNRTRIHG